jgi:predicted RNA-binding Zn-ribbon protein involved in translation (DUF1610 family)
MIRRIGAVILGVLAIVLFVSVGWLAGLVVAALSGLTWARAVGRARAALAYETVCPRGHRVHQYGVFSCSSCGAVNESWIWRCSTCGTEAGWTACPVCGLAVTNPILR